MINKKKIKFWRIKILAKLILSRLPFNYRSWAKFGIFRHGAMDDFSYAWSVLKKHASELKIEKNWKALEMGPGDSVLSSLLAPALGSKGLILVDSGNFAHKDMSLYKKQIENFKKKYPALELPFISFEKDLDKMLSYVNGNYFYNGLQSLKMIKSSSLNLIFSQAVLEHVRRNEFEETMEQCFRLLKPSGIMSHVVDFKDHLGGGLNNLRFPSSLWEQDWFASESGFYTNRLKLSEMLSICENIGFKIKVISTSRWDNLPNKRAQLAKEFHKLSDDDLLISGSHLIMTKLCN
tara:strand:+ start:3560 stop:4435 length:876 start_codon:yes stop_codon:yes gene_type:complete